jgi:glyoxylase-like metal-dependent hydrolase (beta-lactamase superfamily II)
MSKINIIDLHFLGHPNSIAAYLVESTEGLILFETGPHSTYDHLKSGIEAEGHKVEDVKHVFLTHIHLDHAGAAWAFAELGAHIYLHPFGQAHMHDPSKLLASATRIYGDDMDRLWGQLKGISEDKLITVADKTTISIGNIDVKSWHTPGHAVHHIAWQIGTSLIAGDVAGVRIGKGPVVPPCPPPDINIEHWQESIQILRELNLETIYLSHFGAIEKDQINTHLDKLEKQLLDWAAWMKPFFENHKSIEEITPLFEEYIRELLASYHLSSEELIMYENANPSWMSVAGLMRYWKKKTR